MRRFIGCVIVLAVVAVAGCSQTVSGKAIAPSNVRPADIDGLLLDSDEINTIMDTSDLEVAESGDGTDDTVDASPPQCHGVIYISGETEYGDSGFKEMRWQAVASKNGSVVQSVAKFPSSSEAASFVKDQGETWDTCRKVTITAVSKEDGTTSQYQVRSISTQSNKVTALTVVTATDWQCQHLLQAVSSFVLDVSACGPNISDQAEAVASKIAGKIGPG
ncbi:MAG: sensor domain-containing protein [Candidatus Sericytochromatia bacterium]